MFAVRNHDAFVTLAQGEEKLFRLPPMSEGPIFLDAFDNYSTTGPHGQLVLHTAHTSELELTLTHAQLSLPFANHLFTQSQFRDDLWRLKIKRPVRGFDPLPPRQYKITASYTSQLPILQRRIGAKFFHEGFESNWNQQKYIKLRFIGSRLQVLVAQDLASLYGIQPEAADITSGFATLKSIDLSPLHFEKAVDVSSLKLEVGAGPNPLVGGNAMFFSLRAEVPRLRFSIDVPALPDPTLSIDNFHLTMRFYLTALGKQLQYVTQVESDLIDRLPSSGGLRQKIRSAIENALTGLQAAPGTPSAFGDYLTPWLVGGLQDLFTLAYAPGAGDQLTPNGIVERATGELVVSYIGPKPPKGGKPVSQDPGAPPPPPPDTTPRLFNVPDEDPDPLPGGGGGSNGGFDPGDIPRPKPNIGALAKVDHIVVLMQENRSFDQVLGYLRRDKGRLDVEGLLPPGADGSERQRNRFDGREFVPTHADKNVPPRNIATAWPSFTLPGPGHGSDDVRTQMSDDMGNFVSNYARQIGISSVTDFTAQNLRLVMDYFDDSDLATYKRLADHFAICDHWYTAHAGPTWPNRFITLSGELNRDRAGTIEIDNPDLGRMIPLQRDSLFDLLNQHGVPWRVYEHGYSFVRLFKNFTFDTDNVLPFNDAVRGFEVAARSGALPPVTFIEPDYIDLPPGNDDHPPADMQAGQQLVKRIVQALVDSPNWERTLLVITYDEHGGFYDHVQPPTDAPPLAGSFTKLGPRVPAFLVSPMVAAQDVRHERFDHTSIGATILRRFCGRKVPKVSARQDAAKDFREALTRADNPRPRSEFQHLFSNVLPPIGPLDPNLPSSPFDPSGPVKPVNPGLPVVAAPHLPGTPLIPAVPAVPVGPAVPAVPVGPVGPVGPAVPPSLIVPPLLPTLPITDGLLTTAASLRRVAPLKSKDDFHGLLAAIRLFTGQAPKSSGALRRKPLGSGSSAGAGSGGELLFFRDLTRDGSGEVSTPSVIGRNGWQAMRQVFAGNLGLLYAVDAQGRLLLYRDRTQDGTGEITGPVVLAGSGWQNHRHVFSGGDGIVYAVDAQGRLLFHHHALGDGPLQLSAPKVIGAGGWQAMRLVTGGGDGVIYAVNAQGQLLFHRDARQDGSGSVTQPKVIGLGGWQNIRRLLSGGNGILYAVDAQGRLLFHRDLTRSGNGDLNNPRVIDQSGWQAFKFLTSGGNGAIYAVRA